MPWFPLRHIREDPQGPCAVQPRGPDLQFLGGEQTAHRLRAQKLPVYLSTSLR
uniref:Uncharacterized protein n=1 Tax=Zea mays TaxID=4577 RepID=B4FDE8_MAIZE|nr:unknown [Zea mays]